MERESIGDCEVISLYRYKLGTPEIRNDKCLGYAKSETDDEPCALCSNCKLCASHYDEEEHENIIGTADNEDKELSYAVCFDNTGRISITCSYVKETANHYDYTNVPAEILLLHSVLLMAKAWLEGRKVQSGKDFYDWETRCGASMPAVIDQALGLYEFVTGEKLSIADAYSMLVAILKSGKEMFSLPVAGLYIYMFERLSTLIADHLNNDSLRLVECVAFYCKENEFDTLKCLKLLAV